MFQITHRVFWRTLKKALSLHQQTNTETINTMIFTKQQITLTNEKGETMEVSNSYLCNMVLIKKLHFEKMIERAHNNPHLTKEELKNIVEFNKSKIDLMDEINKFCQS